MEVVAAVAVDEAEVADVVLVVVDVAAVVEALVVAEMVMVLENLRSRKKMNQPIRKAEKEMKLKKSHWLIKTDSKNQKVETDATEERITLQRHQVGKILQKSKTPKLKFKPRNEFTEVKIKITEYYLTHKKYRDDSLKMCLYCVNLRNVLFLWFRMTS